MKLEEFLFGVNKDLEEEGLKFVLVRSFEKLPQKNIGSDMDVLVPKKSISKWLEILEKFCETNNLEFKIIRQHHYVVATSIIGVNDKNGKLKLDLNNFLNWRGVDFYQTDDIVQNAKLYNMPIYTASHEYINWYITFCHSFLYGGFINPKYIKQYKSIVKRYPIEFQNILQTVFSKTEANYLINKIKSEDYFVPRYIANFIRISVLLRSFLKKPFYTSYHFVLGYFE